MKALLTIGLMGTALMTGFAGSSPKVARVIFAEAGGMCTSKERLLVASVMKNRIKHQGFDNGGLYTMYDTAYQSGAFTCVNDARNRNWELSTHFICEGGSYDKTQGNCKAISKMMKMNDFSGCANADIEAWNQALMLSRGNFVAHPDIVYYHDKSVTKPKSWDNKYWTAVKEVETEHFVFYSVVRTKII